MKRLVVIGGGVAGCAAARAAAEEADRAGGALEVVLLEREPALGGKARTLRRDGWQVEAGPSSFLDAPGMAPLAALAGLERVEASPAAARRFLVRGGRLVEVSPSPWKLLRGGVLSPLGLLRALGEPFVPRPHRAAGHAGSAADAGGEESVHDFVRRRLGREVAERLADPAILGVHAGDARRISVQAAFPRLAALEREHGSLVRGMWGGMLGGRRRARRGAPAAPAGEERPRRRLVAFREGLQALPERLARHPRVRVRTGVPAGALLPRGPGWALALPGEEPLPADAVVLATEAGAAAEVLGRAAPAAARALGAIPQPHVAVVALGYGAAALARAPRGFGALVPRGEGRVLGLLLESHLFPWRSPPGTLLVRVLVGGSVDPAAAGLADDEVAALAREEAARFLGLAPGEDEPRLELVVRWPRAIAQLEVGHLARVAEVERGLDALAAEGRARPRVAGSFLRGVGFAVSALAGERAGREAARELLRP